MTQTAVSERGLAGLPTSFWVKRFHSLTGIVPVGLFLLEHIWTNSASLHGAESFNQAVEFLRSLPYVFFLEIFGIAVPILYHAFYGVIITAQGRPNNLRFNYPRNWMYLFQRVTGAFLAIYIVVHVYETRIASAIQGVPLTYDYMVRQLSEPGMIFFYAAGMLAATAHFANGLWSFLIGWGVTTSARSMRLSAWICGGIGVLLSVAGINGLLGFIGKGLVIDL